MEKWKRHPKYTNYSVSTYGNVFSHYTNKFKKPSFNSNGYLRVSICFQKNQKTLKKLVFIHKLVLETFVGKRPTLNHICRHYPDQNKTNNKLDNISWSTKQQNNWDRIENNTYNCATLIPDMILEIKEQILQNISLEKLATKYNISMPVLSNIKNGNIWKNIGDDVSKNYYKLRRSKKLTPNDAAYIKLLLQKTSYSQIKIAKIFNVNPSTISNINRGKHFSDVIPRNLDIKEATKLWKLNSSLI